MKTYLLVLLVDLLLAVSLVYVVGDLQWRVAYASSPHPRTTGYATSFAYSVFTRVFTMSGGGISLSSPLTLDWVQVLGVLLVALNGWFLYTVYSKRRKALGATVAAPA
jgi:hypothetical protein